ncbi:MAG: CBS domain-containing protein [Thiomonas sp.]
MNHAPIQTVSPSAALCIPKRAESEVPAVHPQDPASVVMTDFACEYPVVAGPEEQIDNALQNMMRFGVRALVVVEQGAMVGLITAQDILGERPMQFLTSQACTHESCTHRDVLVGDIMTPVTDLPVLTLDALRVAQVGDVAETFKATSQTHLVVIETEPSQRSRLRGLLSRTRLGRQLGMDIAPVSYLPPMQAALAIARS